VPRGDPPLASPLGPPRAIEMEVSISPLLTQARAPLFSVQGECPSPIRAARAGPPSTFIFDHGWRGFHGWNRRTGFIRAIRAIRTTIHESFVSLHEFLPQRTQRPQREAIHSLRSLRSMRLSTLVAASAALCHPWSKLRGWKRPALYARQKEHGLPAFWCQQSTCLNETCQGARNS
jgi:hypothetical protein